MKKHRIHIYTSAHQPATRFVIVLGDLKKPMRFWTRNPPYRTVTTSCCYKQRWAKNCTVQVYYDMVPFWCRDGKGCKGHHERKYVRRYVLAKDFLRGLSVVGLARKYGLSKKTVEEKLRTRL